MQKEIEGKIVDINILSPKEKLPVIIINQYQNETSKLIEECKKEKVEDLILVTISNIDWNREMTPWKTEKVIGSEAYQGEAKDYLQILANKIIPIIKEYIESQNVKITYFALGGYSLAGLFAVYAMYQTNLFQRILSVSGSLWYPKLIDYITNQRKPKIEKIYFSLGNKESITKNNILKNVEDNTRKLEEILKGLGIETIFELNEGNHFQESERRIVKAIKWTIL